MKKHVRLYAKSIRFLPFLFTFGNAFFGFCSLVLALEGERVAAAYCIFLSAMMDALDGRVARLMKVESALGLQLDSLCDAISFCLAPAFLAYSWSLHSLGFVGIVTSGLFLLAGLLRLGRFNLLHDQQSIFFIGLPTTVAGCFIATLFLNVRGALYKSWFAPAGACLLAVLAWLMISSVRFPAFKRGSLRLKRHYHIMGVIALFVVMVVMRLEFTLLFFFVGYFLLSLGYHVKVSGCNDERFLI